MGRFSDERWKAHRAVHRAERRAVDTQAEEYRRRLKDLNHAHQQMVERDSDYVRDEVWRQGNNELVRRVAELETTVTTIQASVGGVDKQRDSTRATWAVVISATVAVVTVVAFIVLVSTHHA
jgi:hypothetical protein